MKLGQNVCLDEDWMSLKMSHVGSKTRALGNILEKPCVGQNVCLDEVLDEFEIGSCGFKN